MKSLYLIRGVSGSGKSTLAEQLSENGKYPVLSADMYFEDSDGNYDWDGSKIKDAHAWCRSQVSCVMSGESKFIVFPNKTPKFVGDNGKIFVANTFTQEWEMEDYFKLAEQYDYQVFTIIVENRHDGKNVHDVPDEILQKMKERFSVKL